MSLSDLTAKVIGDKRRWRAYKARTRRLPDEYRAAVDAVERYLMYVGLTDADDAASVFEDLATLLEQAVANGTPVRDVVGQDPLTFVEALLSGYPTSGWLAGEQARLRHDIDRAAGAHP
ncbi:DUF1048 domain-containing protein [Actinotalea subterranea]|uniref:DUF1048 domain-containing protein n=1 Tax=Actinotalea subterranea TaxID=2607497 RepID=UPI0011EFEB94|nr:DUF1048 domain-containing protein [Actinotalea subterranea]